MQFPLAFTMAMVNVWYKILPENPANDEKFSKEEIEQINQTKASIREFCTNLTSHVQHLLDFLQNVKKERPMMKCYKQVKDDFRYLAFKEVMLRTKGITLKHQKVEENLQHYFVQMESSFDDTVSTAIQTLQSRINDIKDIHSTQQAQEQFKKF